jgi:membrane protease YdiL (CAAX protease family)
MNSDSGKKRTLYLLLVYIFVVLLIVALGNFYLPSLNIRYLNDALKSYSFFYLICFFVLVIILPKKLFKWKWNELHISLSNLIWVVLILFIWISAFLLTNHLVLKTLWSRISIDFFIASILGLITKTFVEEFTYREIVFKKFTQIFTFKYSLIFSIFLSSFLFSIIHLPKLYIYYPASFPDIRYLFVTFIAGMSLCVIYYYTKNFLVLVLLHSFVNFDYEILEPLDFKSFGVNEASIWLTILISILVLVHYTIKRINWKIKIAFNLMVIFLFFAIFYSNNRNESIIEYYKNGSKKATLEDSFLTLYDLRGRTIAFGKYLDGKKVGNWFEYDTAGTIKWQGEYPEELK